MVLSLSRCVVGVVLLIKYPDIDIRYSGIRPDSTVTKVSGDRTQVATVYKYEWVKKTDYLSMR